MGKYKPDWLEKPTVDDMEWAYPAHAQQREIGGKAVIGCRVAHDGRLADCRVVSETPKDEDFGIAALALSQKFRMLPPDDPAAKPAEVTIPVIFQVPDSPRPAAQKRETPPGTLFEIGDLFRVGIVKEETSYQAIPLPKIGTSQSLFAVAAVAFIILIVMVIGLGRRRKPRSPKP
ncbi:MAG: energy transducer TonB [bacterium]|nr:energy transducer TonB [bacterium]